MCVCVCVSGLCAPPPQFGAVLSVHGSGAVNVVWIFLLFLFFFAVSVPISFYRKSCPDSACSDDVNTCPQYTPERNQMLHGNGRSLFGKLSSLILLLNFFCITRVEIFTTVKFLVEVF